jgi:hypothetical protein
MVCEREPDQMHLLAERIARLDVSLLDYVESQTSPEDRRSLLALHAAVAQRGSFRYLEIGSYLGGSLQSFVSDPRCSAVTSIDRRDEESPDERPGQIRYPQNTSSRMLDTLAAVPEANLEKVSTVDYGVEQLDPHEFTADFCFIDGEHTNEAVLRDAQFRLQALRGRGVIAFHDRPLVEPGIRQFLSELPRGYFVYGLKTTLFVVEIGIVPPLLRKAQVRKQLTRPRRLWLAANRLGVARQLTVGIAAARGR